MVDSYLFLLVNTIAFTFTLIRRRIKPLLHIWNWHSGYSII